MKILEVFQVALVFAEPYYHFLAEAVNRPHQGDLRTTLFIILLIDANSVHPKVLWRICLCQLT
jgi:hypothetical protein